MDFGRRYLLKSSSLLVTAALPGQWPALTEERDRDPDASWAELGKGFYRVSGSVNCYILKRGRVALIFDPGTAIDEALLKQLGVDSVATVFLTAHHRERHCGLGNLNGATRELPPVIASKTEAEILAGPTDYRKWSPKLEDRFTVYGASYLRPPAEAVMVSHRWEEASQMHWNGVRITSLQTPGDSPGALTYLLEIDSEVWAVCGGIVSEGQRLAHWYDCEWDYGFAAGVDTLIQSVQKLERTKIDVLLPAWGGIVREPAAMLEGYREKLNKFRQLYVRGYRVFDKDPQQHDKVSQPTQMRNLRQVTPHLYKLNHETQGLNFAIIVSDEGHGLILDCGLLPAKMLDEIIVELRQHVGLKQIDAVWISHMHGDHFLLAPHLKEKYGAESWTLDTIVDACQSPRKYDYSALVNAYGDGFDGMPIDRGFRSGERFEWQGYELQIDWMPGQTRWGCALWLELDGHRIVFTGDNIFGNPDDPQQDGHEAVVCRNDALLEDGYLYAADYLLKLKPDIIMGSHSYVMKDVGPFLERYRRWALQMKLAFQQLLIGPDYQYGFDPYWVHVYPYRVGLTVGQAQEVCLKVKNYLARSQRHRIHFQLPSEVEIDGTIQCEGESADWSQDKGAIIIEGQTSASSYCQYQFRLKALADWKQELLIVPIEIADDGWEDRPGSLLSRGPLFDFLLGNQSIG